MLCYDPVTCYLNLGNEREDMRYNMNHMKCGHVLPTARIMFILALNKFWIYGCFYRNLPLSKFLKK
jgi:hypothetical protein